MFNEYEQLNKIYLQLQNLGVDAIENDLFDITYNKII